MIFYKITNKCIERGRSYPWLQDICDFGEGFAYEQSTLPHQFNLRQCFIINHFVSSECFSSETLYCYVLLCCCASKHNTRGAIAATLFSTTALLFKSSATAFKLNQLCLLFVITNKPARGSPNRLIKNIEAAFLDHRAGNGRRLAALDPSALHKAIILAHEQLGFYLLQCVEDNAHHNQQ